MKRDPSPFHHRTSNWEQLCGTTEHMLWLQCCGRENHGASTSNRKKICGTTEYIHGYNAVGGKTMAPAQPTWKNYAEQQSICHGYNAEGEKTMAIANLIMEKYQELFQKDEKRSVPISPFFTGEKENVYLPIYRNKRIYLQINRYII